MFRNELPFRKVGFEAKVGQHIENGSGVAVPAH